ncbi:hypothetical protein SLEP1_g36933 [Rubroshorea leprosula]|uniref:Uncharacterized protein n=1 Tax=Rubroshorea leprosula TaxID=152421 RepID=A0AAV5KTE1_9ROSI|nr:hypothetical protein SLEP1_g36933 [Rubroshorea leprosula]
MVYAPEGSYHPDLLNSVYITDENKVKFLSKVEVLVRCGEFKKNLFEVVSFIYGISVGVPAHELKRIGNLKFPKSFSRPSAHIPKGLQILYKYLQSYEPHRHCARFFFDPPFLHRWHDRMHYVHDVYMETCYNPSIKKEFRHIIKWDSWEKSLFKFNDVLKENEISRSRNSKISVGSSNMSNKTPGKNEAIIKYYVNIFKHLHTELLHTQVQVSADSSASAPNPIPVDTLESIIEKRLNVSGYVYMAVNEYLKMHPQDVKEFSDRILTWQPLGL